jgi:hypothetical protein
MKFWKKSISSQVKFTTGFRVFTFWEPIIFTTRDVSLWASAKCAVETRTDRLSQEGQREGQELDIRMCCHHIKSEPRTKTFMLHARPHPLSVAQWVKLRPHWRCDDPQKAILSGYLAGFRVGARKIIYILVTWKRLWVIRDTILLQVYVHSFHQVASKEGRNSHVTQDHIGVCHMQTNMNKKASEHMDFRAHRRNVAISTDKSAFSASSHDQCDYSFA